MNETKRECGGCTACCFTPGIVELGKARDTLCAHALPGAGCMRYETRPEVCRGFSCFWMYEGNDAPKGWPRMLHDEERPDKVGVYFTPNGPITVERRRVAWLAAYENRVGEGERWAAKKMLARLARKHLVLVVWRAEWIGPIHLVDLANRHTSAELAVERAKREEVRHG